MALTHRASPHSHKSRALTHLTCFLGIQLPGFSTCITPTCKGLYCSECYRALNNTCSICMAPLSYPDSGDEEMDSSDEETPRLWLGAVRALRGQERGRQLLQRIKDMIRGRRLPFRMAAQLKEKSEKSNVGSSGVANKKKLLCK